MAKMKSSAENAREPTPGKAAALREPAEIRHAAELAALAADDPHPKPEGWALSPRAVRTFLLGSDGERVGRGGAALAVERKFYGDDMLIDRCIVTLMSNRGLILIGEPGTAKTMLSELLAAAVSGDSTLTIQGTAGTTEDQIKYSWNYALLLAEGPTPRAMVPSPLYTGLKAGRIVRFEEITRCPAEIQDTLVSILSDKILHVPELAGADSVVLARRGFNLIATANIRDRGVNEMSSALKRRFNFETVEPLQDRDFETRLVMDQTRQLLEEAKATVELDADVIGMLVATFQDLRSGKTAEGAALDRPGTVMSTAEAVSVAYSAALDACYFGQGRLASEHVVRQLVGTAIKDDPADVKKLRQYFDVVIKRRAQSSKTWNAFYQARKHLRDRF